MLGEMNFSSSDSPVKEPKQDVFRYSHFSKTLSNALSKLKAVEGLVISINGPWGCGKTSVINLIKYYLNKIPDDKQPFIVNFNPWLFTGQEDIIQCFLGEMLLEIKPYKKLYEKIKDDFSILSELVSKGAKFIPVAGDAVKAVTELAKDQLQKRPSLQKTKEKVAELLAQEQRNIIVFIDDIDRLSSSEIRHLFGAIKSIANFPNVLYVLAFDEDVVRTALSKTQDMDGMSYLEKIVQMPFKLPLPDKNSLQTFFSKNFDTLLKSTKQEYLDITRWQKFYQGVFSFYLKTPRAIIRLLNTIRVTYPIVENEVNVVDFVAIELLRVFLPDVYDFIRENEDSFLLDRKHTESSMRYNTDKIKDYHESWMNTINTADKVNVEFCIKKLFPNVDAAFLGKKISYRTKEWRRELRICSRENFQKYFKLTVPNDGISNLVFQAFFEKLNDSKYVEEYLLSSLNDKLPDGNSKTSKYLDILLDHMDDKLPVDKAKSLMSVIFNIGDLINIEFDHKSSLLSYRNMETIKRTLYACCKVLNIDYIVLVHKEAYSSRKGLSTKTSWLKYMIDEHDKVKRIKNYYKEPLLSLELLEELKKLLMIHIEAAADDFTLLDEKEFFLILNHWRRFGDFNKIKLFIDNILSDNIRTIKFIKAFSSYTRTAGQGDITEKNVLRIRLDLMKDFVEIEKVHEKVIQISHFPSNIDTEYKKCLEQFKIEFKAYSEGSSLSEW